MTHRLNDLGPGDGGDPGGGSGGGGGGGGGAKPDDLTDQVFRLLDGKLDADAEAELYWRLECDAEARRVYRRCVNLDVALRLFQAPATDADGSVAGGAADPVAAAATGASVPPDRPAVVRPRRPRWWARTPALASSAAAVVLLGLWLGWGWLGGGGRSSRISEPAGGATLAVAIDARWDGVGPPPGAAVPRGAMSLRAGVVKLSFANRAQVVIAGPARFTVESAGQMSLDRGQLSAVVPAAAAGFTVRTPAARLVDLGTEFAVAVGGDDETQVSVIAGAVAVSPSSGGGAAPAATAPADATPPVRVTAGAGARVAARSARVVSTAATPIAVPRVAQVDAWSAAGAAGDAYRRWQDGAGGAAAAATDRSADLLLLFDFGGVRGEQLTGVSRRGPVVGRVPGRHVGPAPGPFAAAGGALRLDGAGGYAHLGTHPPVAPGPALTLAAWIRPDAIDGSRYVLSTGFDPGHEWEVYLRLVDGTYEAGMGVETDVRDHKVNRPIPPDDVGRWVHVAAVYDGMGWRIYRNGETDMRGGGDPNMVSRYLTGSRDWYAGARARQSAAGAPRTDRFFKGDLDDVRVYAAALTAAEVAELARRHP